MTTSKDKTFVLAGDIGGTKTNLRLSLEGEERPVPEVIETFSYKFILFAVDITRKG